MNHKSTQIVTQTLPVQGMHCASCSAIITRNIKKLPGITNINVNPGTETAQISYDPDQVTIHTMNQIIKPLGYNLIAPEHLSNSDSHQHHAVDPQTQHQELASLKTKVELTLPTTVLLFILMLWESLARYITAMPNLPMPMPLFNTISFLLALYTFAITGQPYLQSLVRFIQLRAANMDTLIGIGTATAFIYSSLIFLFPPVAQYFKLPENTYFDVTVVVLGFITLGKFLELRSKIQTNQALTKLIQLQSKTAIILKDGQEIEAPIDQVQVNDLIIIKPGSKIPVDGIITQGQSSIDESMITGESLPVDKQINALVIGSTINKQGSLIIKATKVGSDTLLSQIIDMVRQAQSSHAPIERLADKVSSIFVPIVLVFSLLIFIVWLTVGAYFYTFPQALTLGILSFVGILVIACPCAMGLATPTAIIVGVGKAAQNGILIKNAESLEKLSSINYVVFDKTGTLTQNQPQLTDTQIYNQNFQSEALQILASLEKHSEHPIAQAIINQAQEKNIEILEVNDFSIIEGQGLTGTINNQKYFAGNLTLIESMKLDIDRTFFYQITQQGKTPIILTNQNQILAIFAVADTIKPEAKQVIKQLHSLGIKTAMLTGDHHKTAQFIASQLEIDNIIAQVLPNHKAEEISKLKKQGFQVAMVGDGINDAPALATSDVGIAMGTGTDIAIESASITLLGGQIAKISQSIKLSRETMKTIKQNLFWAFFYNIISIPVAAGILYPIFGILLNPAIAAAAMAFSSVSVVTNSLKLKTIKL